MIEDPVRLPASSFPYVRRMARGLRYALLWGGDEAESDELLVQPPDGAPIADRPVRDVEPDDIAARVHRACVERPRSRLAVRGNRGERTERWVDRRAEGRKCWLDAECEAAEVAIDIKCRVRAVDD